MRLKHASAECTFGIALSRPPMGSFSIPISVSVVKAEDAVNSRPENGTKKANVMSGATVLMHPATYYQLQIPNRV